jgi:hypothetical protein
MSVKLLFALAAQTVPSACTSRKLEAAKPLDLRVRPLSRFETNSREDSMAARSLRSIATYFITPSLCSNLADWCPVAIIGLGLGSVSFSSVATPCFGQGQCHGDLLADAKAGRTRGYCLLTNNMVAKRSPISRLFI